MSPSYRPGYGGADPSAYSSYVPEQNYYRPSGYRQPQRDPHAEARARALAEQRARRAQWLPDEDDDYDDDEYATLGPRERTYLEARKRQQQIERAQREREEQQRALEERKWQEGLEQRQREEDARRQAIHEQQRPVKQQRREKAKRSEEAAKAKEDAQRRAASKSPSRIPVNDSEDARARRSPSPPQQRPPPPRAPTPKPQYTEKHEEAASRIQKRYRIRQSLQTIDECERKFRDMKKAFTYPTTLDFQKPDGGHVTVQVDRPPPLGFTSANYNLHAYLEGLLKLLMKLDGVESWGDPKEIEAEVSRVEPWWKGVWRDHVQGESKRK
ncbi:hypothetical protein DFP72DRAFT_945183 [Ephemerocybe angulata]|uniref:BAG domain-containing protein n=1 Tax=Ephemerocybe angulata TaxID=980116 RepID=A0A8H6H8A1_9AGAR|nr:hypothetical protein DFP72DRAFT_945183 [Tulosesus angulatus]